MMPRLFGVLSIGAVTAALAQAGVVSGPKEGDKVAPLKVYAVTGEPKNKEVEYAGQRKQKPTVYVFVSAKDFDRPMFRFLKKLDESVGGSTVAVWLTEDADKAKEYLPKISQYFNATALAVSRGTAGPTGWGINPDARLTAVVVDRSRVLKSFGYMSVNETDAPEVAKVLMHAKKE